jgi:hypothetical protein
MKVSFIGITSALLAFGAVYFIGQQDFKSKHTSTRSELYGQNESEEHVAYTFNRLKNPTTGEISISREDELRFAETLPSASASRSQNWQNRGPYNLGGRTRALALDAGNENIILAGQASGGMWRSTDAGANFTKCTQPGQLHSVSCVAQDTRTGHQNTWYYGTGEHYGIVNAAGFSSQFSGDGIFKSTDGGVTWSQLISTASNTPTTLYQKRDFDFVWEIVVNHSNTSQDEVYAAVVNGIWRSVDGGSSWTPVLGLDTSSTSGISQYTDLAFTPTGVLYATISSGTDSKGIWRSTDGVNWTNITPTGFPTSFDRTEIGIAPSDESKVYFITEANGVGTTGHALWHYQYNSGDGTGAGGTWTNRTPNIPDDHCFGFYTFDFKKYSSQSSYDMFFAVHPTDPNIVFLGGTNIYRSTDGFTTDAYDWIGGYQCDTSRYSNYVYPNHHPDQHKLIFLPSNPNIALSGNDGGIMKTQNILAPTVEWVEMNNGYNTGQFYTCAIEPGNTSNEVIVGGLQDNGTFFTNSSDPSQPWKKLFYGDGAYCAITRNRSSYYLSWQTGKIFKFSVDDNGTVTGLTRIDPTGGSGYQFIAPFILDPLNDSVMYLTAGKYIWRNDSLTAIPITGNEYNSIGTGWKRLNATFTGVGTSAPDVSTLKISEANTNRLYYGTTKGGVYRLDSCRFGTPVKTDITRSNLPFGAYVSCVDVDRLNSDKAIVSFSNYEVKSIFYTTDAGTTWVDVSGNLEENPDGTGNGPSVNWVHIYNDGTSVKYFAGTSVGLFSTENLNGVNTVWSLEGANTIGKVVINMITSRASDGNIVVATHGNGIYSNKIFSGLESRPTRLNSSISVYPNPFTESISLKIFASKQETVEMNLYNLKGELLAVKNIALNVGENYIAWNGLGNLPAAQYIVSCKLNDRLQVVKINK